MFLTVRGFFSSVSCLSIFLQALSYISFFPIRNNKKKKVWENRRAYSNHTQTSVWFLPPPFLFLLSFQWHFLWWALRKNSYCLSCQFCFVSSECWVLLCHFQGLFQSLEHSWCFNQELTPWRSWQLIPNQLCGRYIIYFTVHSGIPFSFHHWESLLHSGVLLYKNINNVPFSSGMWTFEGWTPVTPACQVDVTLTNSVKEALLSLSLWFC